MFRISRPNAAEIDRTAEQYSRLELQPDLLASQRGLKVAKLPPGFAHDVSRSRMGTGRQLFEAAVGVFEEWKQFDLGWVRVGNIGGHIHRGQIIAVEICAFGLWSLNVSQIVDLTRDADDFGFIYKTTAHHVEEGEERFLLTFDSATAEVHYELEAVSKPRHWLPRLAYPLTRALQHKFARESHRRVREAASTVLR